VKAQREKGARTSMITFVLHGYEGIDPAMEYGPLQAEFERRGFACQIVRSPKRRTKTPNQDRAQVLIAALRGMEGEIALMGISNQGLFLPLVAAARPIRRIVLMNAVIPHPGQSFLFGSKGEHVWANWFTRMLASRAPGMNEVCPLAELPKVEYVYLSAEHDEAIRPEWEQWAARTYLHVEPVVIKGAGHASLATDYTREVVDAATQGLQPNHMPAATAPGQATSAPDAASAADVAATPQPGRVRVTGGASWPTLIRAAISALAAVIAYFVLRPHVASDTEALAIGWFIPVAWTLVSSVWLRRLDVFALLGVAAYGITLTISIVFGVGSLPLKLHRALVGGAIGLVFLGSVAIRRPILLFLVQRSARGTNRATQIKVALGRPQTVKLITNITLLVGVVALADGALQTILALTLSTGAFLIATTVIHILAVLGIVATLLVALWVRAGRAV